MQKQKVIVSRETVLFDQQNQLKQETSSARTKSKVIDFIDLSQDLSQEDEDSGSSKSQDTKNNNIHHNNGITLVNSTTSKDLPTENNVKTGTGNDDEDVDTRLPKPPRRTQSSHIIEFLEMKQSIHQNPQERTSNNKVISSNSNLSGHEDKSKTSNTNFEDNFCRKTCLSN